MMFRKHTPLQPRSVCLQVFLELYSTISFRKHIPPMQSWNQRLGEIAQDWSIGTKSLYVVRELVVCGPRGAGQCQIKTKSRLRSSD
jgi:hypothetical protein